jgi:hypothetical protein
MYVLPSKHLEPHSCFFNSTRLFVVFMCLTASFGCSGIESSATRDACAPGTIAQADYRQPHQGTFTCLVNWERHHATHFWATTTNSNYVVPSLLGPIRFAGALHPTNIHGVVQGLVAYSEYPVACVQQHQGRDMCIRSEGVVLGPVEVRQRALIWGLFLPRRQQ